MHHKWLKTANRIEMINEPKGSFTPDPARHGTARHACVAAPFGIVVQRNAHGKFQCESGDGGAVPYRIVRRRDASCRAGSGVKEP